jgi:hypothetical protein
MSEPGFGRIKKIYLKQFKVSHFVGLFCYQLIFINDPDSRRDSESYSESHKPQSTPSNSQRRRKVFATLCVFFVAFAV